MRKIIIFLTVLFAVSCSPVLMDIAVDVKEPSAFNVDLKGCPPSVVFISGRDAFDSLLTSRMAVGIAESIENGFSLEEGAVPVYSYFHDEVNVSNPDDVAFLLTTSGSDRVIVLDSLVRDEFSVSYPEGKVLHDTGLYTSTVVNQSFRLGFKMFCMDSLNFGTSSVEASSVVSDDMVWTILADNPVEKEKAVSRAVSSAPKTYSDMGREIGSMFFPQWTEQKRMIVVYEGTNDWYSAYSHAKSFHWEEAMKLWMRLVSSPNPEKVSYAAYNLAVACELQEQYDLALEWLELARSRYPFFQINEEKAYIESAVKQNKK